MAGVISENQKALNKSLHKKDAQFGNRADGAGLAHRLVQSIERLNKNGACSSVLDYGTGKGALVENLRRSVDKSIVIDGYDPAIDKWDQKPERTYDIVTCLDVLEHIERNTIDFVIDDIKSYCNGLAYLVIDLQPAVKRLDDGRNAHVLLAPADWWLGKIGSYFNTIVSFPIFHESGIMQKLVIIASNNPKYLTNIMIFTSKMEIVGMEMGGGLLKGVQSK